MSETRVFQLPNEYFEGSYGTIALNAEQAAKRLKIAGIISGIPAFILDGKPFREPTTHEMDEGHIVRHYFYGPAAYTLRDHYELVGDRWEFEIDVPTDPAKPAYTYFGLHEFGDATLLEPPIPYDQVAFDAAVKAWRESRASHYADD